MKPSSQDLPQSPQDLQALRRAIALLADRCGVDLTDRATLRRVLDGDYSDQPAALGKLQDVQDLSAMLTLLFRLEACSSEDLGITGLRHLWRLHGRMLARFRVAQAIVGAGPEQLAAS